jgi:hypothetical protein
MARIRTAFGSRLVLDVPVFGFSQSTRGTVDCALHVVASFKRAL